MTVATKQWWQYPADSPGGGYQEITDPFGNYLKPDTNIAVPAGTPITALLPGTVTDVSSRGTGDGGLSVTVKLDNAINSMAQYVSYNFLGGANVQVGQHLSSGQQLGVAGSPLGVDFALGLGVSPSWGAQCPQCSSKQPLLDPRQLLNAALAGKLGDLTSFLNSGNNTNPNSSGNQTDCGNFWDTNFLPCSIDNWITSWLSSDQAHQIMLVVFALIVMIIGIVILFSKGDTSAKEASTK
jgi:hypothetical protein